MYTYGRNARTHFSVLVLVKRLLTLLETTAMTAPKALILLSDDEQIHPVLRANIKEAQSRATKDVGTWSLFWMKEDIFNFMLRNIMLNCYHSDSIQVLRSVLSLAAFEEGKLVHTVGYDGDEERLAWLI
jgi:hypothetical protein